MVQTLVPMNQFPFRIELPFYFYMLYIIAVTELRDDFSTLSSYLQRYYNYVRAKYFITLSMIRSDSSVDQIKYLVPENVICDN